MLVGEGAGAAGEAGEAGGALDVEVGALRDRVV